MTFGPTYQSTSHSVLQPPIAFKLGMKYPKIPINGYSNLDFSISACGNRSSQFLIYWDTEWWNTVAVEDFYAFVTLGFGGSRDGLQLSRSRAIFLHRMLPYP